MISTQAHTMPQKCLERMPDVFQSENPQQKAIEKVWEVIQGGLHVRHATINYVDIYVNYYTTAPMSTI